MDPWLVVWELRGWHVYHTRSPQTTNRKLREYPRAIHLAQSSSSDLDE